MKIFPSNVRLIIESLSEIFRAKGYADIVLKKLLKNAPKLGARDRKFVAETVYDIVRFKRLLHDSNARLDENHENYFKALIATYLVVMKGYNVADIDFIQLNFAAIKQKYSEVKSIRKIRESIPDWLDDLGVSELSAEKWERELEVLNHPAEAVIRANGLKVNRDKLQKLLSLEGIETSPHKELPDALIVNGRKNLFSTDLFKDGLFEMQDVNSQRVAEALDVKPGMRVIDACAGAGGKALHIATKMQNKGKLITLDLEEWKLTELLRRSRRNGVTIVDSRAITSTKVIKRLTESADRVLLDVPCSGLGVLKRNPDAKWKLSLESIANLRVEQEKILTSYSRMVKEGGLLVYSTCSILPSENQNQIEKFLNSNKDKFELVNQTTYYPSETGFDGFFIAVLRKI